MLDVTTVSTVLDLEDLNEAYDVTVLGKNSMNCANRRFRSYILTSKLKSAPYSACTVYREILTPTHNAFGTMHNVFRVSSQWLWVLQVSTDLYTPISHNIKNQ